MVNGISFPKKFGSQLGIRNASSTFSTMLSLSSCPNSCLVFSLNKLSLFKVHLTPSTEKECLETTLFPNKISNINIFFWIKIGSEKKFFQTVGLGMGLKNSVPKF